MKNEIVKLKAELKKLKEARTECVDMTYPFTIQEIKSESVWWFIKWKYELWIY